MMQKCFLKSRKGLIITKNKEDFLLSEDEFKEDLAEFIKIINNENEESLIKKEYISLVKKYHPDSAPQEKQDTYNEYMILINKVYSKGKTSVNETVIKKHDEQKQTEKIYSFTSYYNTEFKFTDYYKYIYEKGKNEWDWATCMLGGGGQNHANDPKGLSDHTCEVMQHFYNATLCLKEALKHAQKIDDLVTVATCQDMLKRIYKSNNKISKSILNSQDKQLLI